MKILFKILILFFFLSISLETFSQTLLLPLKTTKNTKDSVVHLIIEEKQDSTWIINGEHYNTYSYSTDGLLQKVIIYDQKYTIKYKKETVKIVKFYNGEKSSKYIYYGYPWSIDKIKYYIYLDGVKEFWGNEYLTYDSINRVISSSYIVENRKSMHNGYSHSATYEYNLEGQLTVEYWGYKEVYHYYKENGIIDFSLIFDHEFGVEEEWRRRYEISTTTYD